MRQSGDYPGRWNGGVRVGAKEKQKVTDTPLNDLSAPEGWPTQIVPVEYKCAGDGTMQHMVQKSFDAQGK